MSEVYQNKMLVKYCIALLVGILVGYKVIPATFMGVVYAGLIVLCSVYILQKNIDKIFLLLPYIVFGEIYIRGHVRSFLPYLTVQYLFIFGFLVLIIKSNFKKADFHFKYIGFLIAFFLLEVFNGFLAERFIITRGIQTNTLALLMPAIWASFYKFSPYRINKLMDDIRLATIFLAGIVLVAHLQGKIDYGGGSNSDASNSMAPVQLSGYLGTGCILFLISIFNPQDKRSKIIQAVVFVFLITLMALTFSRGGIYFVAVITLLYLIFNRTNFGTYFKFLIFIPIGFMIYNFVVDETGGKIIDRYKAKGASNREELVLIGFYIFSEHPIIGIGSGNYSTYIKRNRLFPVESGVHNEFVRAAAEHGIVGISLYWTFFILLLVTILRRPKPANQYGVYFLVLFFLITIHNGLKISVQPFILILAISIVPITNYSKKSIRVSPE